ncbi:hypothetical protein DM02DRAFT_148860 [Periconia macrospinosa]|uniref:Uncharacterized protein n=1 Tax=Periconia macrospinosa TaxID=97972 RepID=A0A2V1DD23_9PLEO|nr:hypothetical protein DM02DRAFT_148860 [Periconia macrospinosa]
MWLSPYKLLQLPQLLERSRRIHRPPHAPYSLALPAPRNLSRNPLKLTRPNTVSSVRQPTITSPPQEIRQRSHLALKHYACSTGHITTAFPPRHPFLPACAPTTLHVASHWRQCAC